MKQECLDYIPNYTTALSCPLHVDSVSYWVGNQEECIARDVDKERPFFT